MDFNFTKLYDKAVQLATEKHSGQKYGDCAYTAHLVKVEEVTRRYFDDTNNIGRDLIIGAWLHDIIEDTDTSYVDVKDMFGKDIAELVYAVTNELGRNRQEKARKTYPKIKKHPYATYLKLADRIANIECSQKTDQKFKEMYKNERELLKKYLYVPNVAEKVWTDLITLYNTKS